MQIRIELKSDTAPGSGEGETGIVDRDITHSANGLPLITARRIKGCLREAALEVREALEVWRKKAGQDEILKLETINLLFGSRYGEQSQPGYLQLSDAVLEDAEKLQPWLKFASEKNKQLFGPAAVLANYTGLRTQTSMARVTGGSLSNTLRVSRVICKGYRFVAEAKLVRPYSVAEKDREELRQVLAWACAATRHIGLSRNRGLGHVEITLQDQDDGYNSKQALDDLTKLLGQAGRIA